MSENETPSSGILSDDQWKILTDIMLVKLQQISVEKDALSVENEWLRQKVERLESEQQSYATLQQEYEALVVWSRAAHGRLRIYAPRSDTYRNAPDVVKQDFETSKGRFS